MPPPMTQQLDAPPLPLDPSHLPSAPGAHRAITWRSVLLGFFGVAFICGITPYNDYAVNNSYFVGNNLPLGVVVLIFVFALIINGPLSKFAPRFAFSTGEMTVMLSMMLVGCALPSSGLMRYFPPSL